MTNYTYPLTAFVGLQTQEPAWSKLHGEVLEQAAIVAAFDGVNRNGSDAVFQFREDLTADGKTALDNVVEAHDGISLVEPEDPRTSDGKRIFLMNMFPGDVTSFHVGCSDDIENGKRFEGPLFRISTNEAGESPFEFQFMEWIYLAGGEMFAVGAGIGDRLSYEVYAPATEGVSDPGDGAFDKVEVVPGSGLNTFVPNPNGTGDWDLDLSEPLNGNVGFSKVVPVPALDGDGFFDWDGCTEQVTLNPLQKGGYHLLDFPKTLARFVQKVPLTKGEVQLTKSGIKPKKILAQWKHKVTINNATAKQLDIEWYVYGARRDVT